MKANFIKSILVLLLLQLTVVANAQRKFQYISVYTTLEGNSFNFTLNASNLNMEYYNELETCNNRNFDSSIALCNCLGLFQLFGLSFDPTSAITPQQAYNGTFVARVGHHNDCFLADDNDMGTYWRNNRLDTALAKTYLQFDSRFVPMGGETCQQSKFTMCANALRELARLRWSFLNADFNTDVLKSFESNGCLDEMKRRLGYRFSLLNAEFTSRVSQSGPLTFAMTLTNTGWAAPFNRRDVELLLRNIKDGSVFSLKLPVDPRFRLAGDTASVNVSVGIPSTMKGGW